MNLSIRLKAKPPGETGFFKPRRPQRQSQHQKGYMKPIQESPSNQQENGKTKVRYTPDGRTSTPSAWSGPVTMSLPQSKFSINYNTALTDKNKNKR